MPPALRAKRSTPRPSEPNALRSKSNCKTSKKSIPFDYDVDYKSVNLRERPELYRIGKGEQGELYTHPDCRSITEVRRGPPYAPIKQVCSCANPANPRSFPIGSSRLLRRRDSRQVCVDSGIISPSSSDQLILRKFPDGHRTYLFDVHILPVRGGLPRSRHVTKVFTDGIYPLP